MTLRFVPDNIGFFFFGESGKFARLFLGSEE